jgi:hypothetical protein
MVVVLATTPVTMPVDAPTVAMDVLLLDHVPPLVVSASVVVDPTHMLMVPVIAATEQEDVFTCAHHVSQLFAVVPEASCKVQKDVLLVGSRAVAE